MQTNGQGATRRTLVRSLVFGAAASALGEMVSPAMPSPVRLRRGSPETLGIDPAGVVGFVDAVGKSVGGLHGFVLMRHGRVGAEGWWRPYGPKFPHMLYSLSKSFTSTAVGIAVAEGRLSVSDPVTSFFPELLPARLSANQAAMTVHHLLTMSTGHDKDATGPMRDSSGGDWVRSFLALPVEHKPGSKFVYNSAATYMCSAIVQKLTGETVLDYLRPRLFEPLGIEKPTWEVCPKGISVGGWGLSVTTEDIARFGQLYLNQGLWNGDRLVSESWIAEATRKQVSNGTGDTSDWTQGYGYQFWRSRHGAYRGDGAFGQYCIVFPEHDAVLAITSGVGDMQAVLNDVWNHILPAFRRPAAKADLKAALAKLEVPFTPSSSESPSAERYSGKVFRIASNPQGVRSVSLSFRKGSASVRIEDAAGAHRFECGYSRWGGGQAPQSIAFFPSGPAGKVAARGGWTGPSEFTATLAFVETPYIQKTVFQFEGDRLTVRRQLNVSFGARDLPSLTGQLA